MLTKYLTFRKAAGVNDLNSANIEDLQSKLALSKSAITVSKGFRVPFIKNLRRM